MRLAKVIGIAFVIAALPGVAAAQEAFDACEVFTVKDAEAALGGDVFEATVFKGKRPKVVTDCRYTGSKDGKSLSATAQFKFARNESDMRQAFADARMELQTKPLVITGQEAFWSGKTGTLHMRKGRTWVTVSVGPEKPVDRDMETARKVAEGIAKKL
jgi:hypothetical protein